LCFLSPEVLREDSIIIIDILLDSVLDKFLGAADTQLFLKVSLDFVLVHLILEFLLDSLILHWDFNPHNGTIVLEDFNELLLMIVIREIFHDDGSMIEYLILKVFFCLHLDLFVVEPDVSEAFLEDFDLSR
jgi:hypothetical protein